MNDLVTVSTTSIAPVTLPASENPCLVYLASLSSGSRRTMSDALETIARTLTQGQCSAVTLPWGSLRFQHTRAIASYLAENYAAATANKMLSALRGTLKTAKLLGQMSAEDYDNAVTLKNIKGETLLAGRNIEPGEIAALFAACEKDRKEKPEIATRDTALLALLRCCILRRSEAAGLDTSDYSPDSGEIRIRNAKGNKARNVFISGSGKAALDAWLDLRNTKIEPTGPLFVRIGRWNTFTANRLTDEAIRYINSNRCQQAGVKETSPHDWRRTGIGDYLTAGVDIATVAKIAGHASVTTTARYDRRSDDAKKAAAGMLHVPYSG